MNVRFLKLAETEFDDAVTHYESEQLGLGLRFRSEVSHSLKRIIDFPTAYPVFGLRTRRCLIAKFPYALIYRYEPPNSEVLVVTVAHLHRAPRYWVARVP